MKFTRDGIVTIFRNFKGLTAIGTGDIISKAVISLFWLYMASMLGDTNYGQINYHMAIGAIAATVSTIGASTTLTVYVAKGVKLEATFFFISLLVGIVAAISLGLFFNTISVAVYVFGYILALLALAETLGAKSYYDYSKNMIIQSSLMIGLGIGFYHIMGIEGVLLGIGLSYFWYIRRIIQGFKKTEIDFSLIRTRLSTVLGNYAILLATVVSGSIDRLLIAPFFGFALLGNYALGLQFLALLNIIPNNVYRYILPQDASGVTNKRLKQLTILVSVGLALSGVFISPFIVPIFFPKFNSVTELIQILSISVIPATVNSVYSSKFLGMEKSSIVFVATSIFLGLQVIGIIVLGNIFGVKGLAFAYLISTVVQTVFLITMDRLQNRK